MPMIMEKMPMISIGDIITPMLLYLNIDKSNTSPPKDKNNNVFILIDDKNLSTSPP